MSAEVVDASSWEQQCIHYLAQIESCTTPKERICELLRTGQIRIPAVYYTFTDDPEIDKCILSICGFDIRDDTFARDWKALIRRLFLSMLLKLVKRSNTTIGVACTILISYLRQTLDTASCEKVLNVVSELMSESITPGPGTTMRRSGYPYLKLPQDGTSLRLLVLLPRSSSSQRISCKLAHQSLLDGSKYEALSYVWGNPKDTVDILVDGQEFPITKNLHKALRALRNPTEPRVLWVDAICIDQANQAERAWQVGLMGKLFRQAERVIAWLGPEPEEHKIIFKTLNGNRGKTKDFWRAFYDFLRNDYFRRAWIIQEITLSLDVVIQYGASSCPLELIYRTLIPKDRSDRRPERRRLRARRKPQASQLKETSSEKTRLGIRQVIFVAGFRNILIESKYLTLAKPLPEYPHALIWVFLVTRTSSCLDPRDKVFSMLEIHRVWTGQIELLVEPNYQRSVEQIMIDAAQSNISIGRNLNILRCTEPPLESRALMLPSWVPEWRWESGAGVVGNPMSMDPPIGIEYWRADFEENNRILKVSGLEIGTIKYDLDVDFSDNHAFLTSVLRSVSVSISRQSSTDNLCGTNTFWLAILSFADKEKLQSIKKPNSDVETSPSVVKPKALDCLRPGEFPPQTPDAALALSKIYWGWFLATQPQEAEFCKRKVFGTTNGSYIATLANAKQGDRIVMFPNTIHLVLLRPIGGHYYFVGIGWVPSSDSQRLSSY
jgi:hypothetical protein